MSDAEGRGRDYSASMERIKRAFVGESNREAAQHWEANYRKVAGRE